MTKLNVIADTHNVPALEQILNKLTNVVSLGDIAAVDTSEYFQNVERYSTSWKEYKKERDTMNQTDREWFEQINLQGWQAQMEMIGREAKGFKVVMGNSDEYVLEQIPNTRAILTQTLAQNPSFEFLESIKLEQLDNVQFLYLPYRKTAYSEILDIVKNLDSNKSLFVFGHCPPYTEHRKEYYVHHYQAIAEIAKHFPQPFHYFHGHVHADQTYTYELPSLPGVKIITPRAEDSDSGIGSNHDYVEIDTETGEIKIFNLTSGQEVSLQPLPTQYYTNSDHWNGFGL